MYCIIALQRVITSNGKLDKQIMLLCIDIDSVHIFPNTPLALFTIVHEQSYSLYLDIHKINSEWIDGGRINTHREGDLQI